MENKSPYKNHILFALKNLFVERALITFLAELYGNQFQQICEEVEDMPNIFSLLFKTSVCGNHFTGWLQPYQTHRISLHIVKVYEDCKPAYGVYSVAVFNSMFHLLKVLLCSNYIDEVNKIEYMQTDGTVEDMYELVERLTSSRNKVRNHYDNQDDSDYEDDKIRDEEGLSTEDYQNKCLEKFLEYTREHGIERLLGRYIFGKGHELSMSSYDTIIRIKCAKV